MKNLFYGFKNTIQFFSIAVIVSMLLLFVIYQTLSYIIRANNEVTGKIETTKERFYETVNRKINTIGNIAKIIINDEALGKYLIKKDTANIINRLSYFSPLLEMTNIEIIDNDLSYYTSGNTPHLYRLNTETAKKLLTDVQKSSLVMLNSRSEGIDVRYILRGESETGSLFTGLLVLGFSFDLNGEYTDYLHSLLDMNFFIVDNNNIVTTTFFDESMSRLTNMKLPDDIKSQLEAKDRIIIKKYTINSSIYSVMIENLSFNRGENIGLLGIAYNTDEIQRVIIQNVLVTIISVIAFSLIIILFSVKLAARITGPIGLLSKAAKINAGGGFETVDIVNNNEIGDFTNNFNSMIRELRDVQNNLEKKVIERTQELKESNDKLVKANEIMKQDLTMAQRIQGAMIPKSFGDSRFVNISGNYIPMENVGGDLYDVFYINENKVGIVILDVCGHGVPAAFVTMMAKISFGNNSKKYDTAGEVVSAVNKEINNALGEISQYLTAFYCIIDTKKMTMDFTNAGHTDIFLMRNDDKIEHLKSNSFFVGIKDDIEFSSNFVNLNKGDKVFLYTDGVIETRNNNNELFGYDRLKVSLIKHKDLVITKLPEIIVQEVEVFKENKDYDDDIAILAVELV